MANTDLSYYAEDTYIGGNFLIQWTEAGDAAIKTGNIVEGDATDAGEVLQCTTDGMPYGASALQVGLDIDTAAASGDVIEIYLKAATMIWAKHDGTAETLLRGLPMSRSNSAAGANELFVYADGTSEVISYVGYSNQLINTGGVAIWFQLVLV